MYNICFISKLTLKIRIAFRLLLQYLDYLGTQTLINSVLSVQKEIEQAQNYFSCKSYFISDLVVYMYNFKIPLNVLLQSSF